MQSVLPAVQRAGEAVSAAMSSNKKLADLQKDTRHSDGPLTNDHGVKQENPDIWCKWHLRQNRGVADSF